MLFLVTNYKSTLQMNIIMGKIPPHAVIYSPLGIRYYEYTDLTSIVDSGRL